jgi:hypothetical protein
VSSTPSGKLKTPQNHIDGQSLPNPAELVLARLKVIHPFVGSFNIPDLDCIAECRDLAADPGLRKSLGFGWVPLRLALCHHRPKLLYVAFRTVMPEVARPRITVVAGRDPRSYFTSRQPEGSAVSAVWPL